MKNKENENGFSVDINSYIIFTSNNAVHPIAIIIILFSFLCFCFDKPPSPSLTIICNAIMSLCRSSSFRFIDMAMGAAAESVPQSAAAFPAACQGYPAKFKCGRGRGGGENSISKRTMSMNVKFSIYLSKRLPRHIRLAAGIIELAILHGNGIAVGGVGAGVGGGCSTVRCVAMQ